MPRPEGTLERKKVQFSRTNQELQSIIWWGFLPAMNLHFLQQKNMCHLKRKRNTTAVSLTTFLRLVDLPNNTTTLIVQVRPRHEPLTLYFSDISRDSEFDSRKVLSVSVRSGSGFERSKICWPDFLQEICSGKTNVAILVTYCLKLCWYIYIFRITTRFSRPFFFGTIRPDRGSVFYSCNIQMLL